MEVVNMAQATAAGLIHKVSEFKLQAVAAA
jgi:hypothetical protein